jgi:DNA-binding XRE family transcriptional regulator
MQIYNRLQLIRTERNVSRQALAEAVGVNPQTIGFIERGDYGPSLELAFKIADFFNVPLESIFSSKLFPTLFDGNVKELRED